MASNLLRKLKSFIIQNKLCFFVQLYKDLLHPSVEEEKRRCKLKRLVQSPNSYFMDVKCPGTCSACRVCIVIGLQVAEIFFWNRWWKRTGGNWLIKFNWQTVHKTRFMKTEYWYTGVHLNNYNTGFLSQKLVIQKDHLISGDHKHQVICCASDFTRLT